MNKRIDVIELAFPRPAGITRCNGCGLEKPVLLSFYLRTGPTTRQFMCWCRMCAVEVTTYVAASLAEPDTTFE